jgi:SAM-dependent methyltransferase
MTALVPGCGRAYDALALAGHGFESVVAVDVSPSACAAALAEIGGSSAADRVDVRCGDFFTLDTDGGVFDLIWDNTFLWSLEPSVRKRWAEQMKALLAPGGELITCVFPIGDREGGPPYAISVPLVRSLLEPVGFEATLVQDRLPLEEQHRRPGDDLESVLTRGSALVTWRLK